MRVLAWLTITAAFSSVPPLLRYAVMPEAVIAYPALGVCWQAIDVTYKDVMLRQLNSRALAVSRSSVLPPA